MRTKFIDRNDQGDWEAEGYRNLSDLPVGLSEVLALATLRTLTITDDLGHIRTYHAIEYDCRACGEYGHEERECPELCQECIRIGELDPSDRPSMCDGCGENWR